MNCGGQLNEGGMVFIESDEGYCKECNRAIGGELEEEMNGKKENNK